MKVFVINKHDLPLMPCSPMKARHLLEQKKAKVVRMEPFTIRLSYGSAGYRQPVSLGVDAGSKTIGLSATTAKEELFSAEVTLRTDVSKNIAERSALRRNRRYRKTRYRKPRFDNRKKEDGWIAPSVEQKIGSHVEVVRLVHELLPVSEIRVEVAQFDIRKIQNPGISGKDYQEGPQLDFWNVREYVLFRDNHRCRHCHRKGGDVVLNVHHIESRKTGGDSPGNLVTLCVDCHRQLHNGDIMADFKRSPSFRDASFMGIMRRTLYERLKGMYPVVGRTFGYVTKHRRIALGLAKMHCTDAFCIAGNLEAAVSPVCYKFRRVRKHNRSLHVKVPAKDGKRRSAKAPYFLGETSFTRYDKVICNGVKCFIFGSSNGQAVIKDIDGKRTAGVRTVITPTKLKLLYHMKGGMICDTQRVNKFMQPQAV